MPFAPARRPVILTLLLCFAGVPQASLSDDPTEASAETVATPEAVDEEAIPAEQVVESAADRDEMSRADAALTNSIAMETENWVCRKETPTGSHRSIKVCRRKADIEDSIAEVEQVMNRQKQYGNPSVTPRG